MARQMQEGCGVGNRNGGEGQPPTQREQHIWRSRAGKKLGPSEGQRLVQLEPSEPGVRVQRYGWTDQGAQVSGGLLGGESFGFSPKGTHNEVFWVLFFVFKLLISQKHRSLLILKNVNNDTRAKEPFGVAPPSRQTSSTQNYYDRFGTYFSTSIFLFICIYLHKHIQF